VNGIGIRAKGSKRRAWQRHALSIRWPLLASVPAAVALVRKRRKIRLPRLVSLPVAGSVPLAVAVALPRGRLRAAAIWGAQMWAYKVAFEMPYDDPDALYRRLRIDEPIRVDRALGGGEVPGERLQRRLRQPPRLTWLDRLASLLYFSWELEPHAAMLWVLLRHPEGFRGAAGRLGDLRPHADRLLRSPHSPALVGIRA
jgi:hypothetical protein